MSTPKGPFSLTGGCACRRIRYNIDVPAHDKRAPMQYKSSPDADVGDIRLPWPVFCSCNDCRRHSASVLPAGLVTEAETLTFSILSRDVNNESEKADETRTYQPVYEVLNDEVQESSSSALGIYDSSPGKRRYFCSFCGTPLAYTSLDIVKQLGWPPVVDLWLATLDRECLEQEWMQPQQRVHGHFAIPWVRSMLDKTGLKICPWYKTDQTFEDFEKGGDREMLEKAGRA